MTAVDTVEPADLPAGLAAILRRGTTTPLLGGGSPALLWRLDLPGAPPLVVKALTAGAGRVDGHDLASFRRKPRQIARVHAELPGLAPAYVRVVDEWSGPGWAAYAMPYLPGGQLTDALRGYRPDLDRFRGELRTVLAALTTHGYAVHRSPAPADHFHTTHLDRVRRRLPLLRAHLESDLFDGAGLVVNGRRCPALVEALDLLSGRAAVLTPGRLSFPVHGDLNLGNLVIDRSPAGTMAGFTVVDPRGTDEDWDPVYDLAKMLFSLSTFDAAMAGGFAIARAARRDYQVRPRLDRPGYRSAAGTFEHALRGLPFTAELDRTDPDWRYRLAVVHAVHHLAEAACRLSDRTPRTFGSVRGWAACTELARGLLLSGLLLVAELVSDSGSGYGDAAAWRRGAVGTGRLAEHLDRAWRSVPCTR